MGTEVLADLTPGVWHGIEDGLCECGVADCVGRRMSVGEPSSGPAADEDGSFRADSSLARAERPGVRAAEVRVARARFLMLLCNISAGVAGATHAPRTRGAEKPAAGDIKACGDLLAGVVTSGDAYTK